MASTFSIDRSIRVDAAPATIYPYLVDFHEWTKWSPWEDPEIEMAREYTGTPGRPGAGYELTATKDGARATMELRRATEPVAGEVRIEFHTPPTTMFDIAFDLVEHGSSTEVRWALTGKHTMMTRAAKATGMLEKLGGKELTRGLDRLKAAVEAGAGRSH